MNFDTMKKGHPLWEKTMAFAAACSWSAGQSLAKRMEDNAFLDWERVIVATEGETMVGFAVFSEKDGLPEAYSCTPFVSLVFVTEAYRGKRVSQQLIDHTIAYAKELGYQTVYLKSEHRGLYEKYGFEKIGEFEPVEPPADQLFQLDI